MRLLISAVAFSVILGGAAGCAELQNAASVITGSVATTAPQTVADAEKGLTLAHLAYQGVSFAIQDAVASGFLKGTDAATVKEYYDKAGALLDAADAADNVADAKGISEKVSAVNDLLAKIGAMLPKSKGK